MFKISSPSRLKLRRKQRNFSVFLSHSFSPIFFATWRPVTSCYAQAYPVVVVVSTVLTFVTERSLSSSPLETLNNGVFDSVKQTLVHLETKRKHVQYIYLHITHKFGTLTGQNPGTEYMYSFLDQDNIPWLKPT